MRTLEERLQAVEDELSIRNLVARYTDAINQRDLADFRQLWTDNAVWEIGPPLQSRADGIDEIVALLSRLLQAEKYFMQMTHSGVIEIKGDRATARFVERERGLVNQLTTTVWLSMKMFSCARQTVGVSQNVFITTASWIKAPLEAMHFQSPDANSEEQAANDLMTKIRGGKYSKEPPCTQLILPLGRCSYRR